MSARARRKAGRFFGVDRSFGPPRQLTTVTLTDGTVLITHVAGTPLLGALQNAEIEDLASEKSHSSPSEAT